MSSRAVFVDIRISAKVLYVKGRQHPVKIYYAAISQVDYVDAALRTFYQIHTDSEPGDVLIFLPGTLCHDLAIEWR